MKRFGRKKIVVLISLFLTFLVVLQVLIAAVQILQYGKTDNKTKCDVAIVLGAAASDEGVSPVYRERINHGIWLYENGYVDFFTWNGIVNF